MIPRVVVVGLGPAGAELLTERTRELIAAVPAPRRFVRTRRHPAAAAVAPAVTCDDIYETAPTLEAVYAAIVERLVAAAAGVGEVLYAVPGSPAVAERSVQLLLADGRVRTEVHPALSFTDLAWTRLGVDPLTDGVRIVDGRRFAVEAAGERGPLLVAQCDNAEVLAEVQQALAPEAEVWVLHHLGAGDERVETLRAGELPGWTAADHLTSLYVPRMAAPVAPELVRFGELVTRLRAECPWDRCQTHHSLRRHLLEEVYEVIEAIDALPEPPPGPTDAVAAGEGYEALEEELGDLLFHVFFHAVLAAEQGQFTIADVVRTVDTKLRRRHPHVFGDEAGVPADVASPAANWEQIKKAEKGRTSAMDGIPEALPALLGALKVQKRAEAFGLEMGGAAAALGRLREALEAPETGRDEAWLGRLLFDAVELARHGGLDPESALRSASRLAREEFRRAENDGPDGEGAPW